jgi:hypothetical protein
MRVLEHPSLTRVIDADNNEGSDLARVYQIFGDRMQLPVVPTKGRSRIEQILPVMHVAHRISTFRRTVVAGREINDYVAFVF